MKKTPFIILAIVSSYILFITIYHFNCNAKYLYENEEYLGIIYNNRIYIPKNVVEPLYLIYDDNDQNDSKIYIAQKFLSDLFIPFQYFVFYSESYDFGGDFIVERPDDSSLSVLHIDKDFVYPTIDKNEVDEIWGSLSSSNEDNIKDLSVVNHIVECAKSNGELALDKEVYEQIKENSWDNHYFYLKYKGYPLVEKFYIEETEDGRYIVDRYTEAEYDTVYLDDHK